MCYGDAKFTGGNSQKKSRYLPSPVYRCRVWWIQNWLQFQQYFSESVSSISSVKNSPANAIKISAAILQTVNLLSFSAFDRYDSDRPEKINILLLSGCCLWKKTFEGSEFSWHTRDETRSQSFTSSCARSTFCFCLQRAGVLFAACGSFVCSV